MKLLILTLALCFTAGKGSRLRLVVSSVNSILWQKNYCSGGVVADETAKDARTCNIQVYHDAEHASAIQLPLR